MVFPLIALIGLNLILQSVVKKFFKIILCLTLNVYPWEFLKGQTYAQFAFFPIFYFEK